MEGGDSLPSATTSDTSNEADIQEISTQIKRESRGGHGVAITGDINSETPEENVTPSDKAHKENKNTKSSGSKKKKGGQSSLADIKRRGRTQQAGRSPQSDVILDQFSKLSIDTKDTLLKRKGTGLVYDERMMEHKNMWNKNFPECPERIEQSYQKCKDYGLVDRCVRIKSRYATEKEVLSQHTNKLLKLVQSSQDKNTIEELKELSRQNEDVYFSNETHKSALLSLGCVLELTNHIVQEKVDNGIAIVRPPGHHASKDAVCGYSFFNNVAIAATHALDVQGLKRVLIVDWDVHHGQGTQYLLYDDPRVLYFSIHRYEFGHFWPNLRESDYNYIGEGPGRGYNVNVPLNKIGMANSDYLAIFYQLLMPIAYEYNPELVLVSAGYDAALGCPEGEMKVSPACYAHFIHLLSTLASGKLAVILEGGYCLKSLSESVTLTLRSLLGDPCPRIGPMKEPCDSITESILNVIKVLRPYWKCLAFQGKQSEEQSPEVSSSTDDYRLTAPFLTVENRPKTYDVEDYPTQDTETKNRLDKEINQLIKDTDLSKPKHKLCLVYDEKMRRHKNAVDPSHPERPDRITRIFDLHKELGLLDRCHRVDSRTATVEELLLAHKLEYIEELQRTKITKPRDINKLQDKWNSIYLSQDTYDCACMASGCLLNVVDKVMTGQVQRGVAVTRPPGHHAESHEACGFCFFNNVPIATRYAQQKYANKGINKVLIVDWDVHHGNGIQHIFEDDPSVLYISIHRYDYGFFFPVGEGGNYDKVGLGKGKGFNINIPWNERCMGDVEYITAFLQVVMPVASQFDPDMVFVSAGFDAALGDPLGGCCITPEGYAHLTHMLMSLAAGKVILALEGGYNLNSISKSMAMCSSILLGDLCPPVEWKTISTSAVESIVNVLDTQQHHWSVLKFRVDLPVLSSEDENEDENVNNSNREPTSQQSDKNKLIEEDLCEGIQSITVSSTTDPETENTATTPGPVPANILSDLASTAVSSTEDAVSGSQDRPSTTSSKGAPAAYSEEDVACGGPTSSTIIVEADFLGANRQSAESAEMYAVVPLPWCPHLVEINTIPSLGLDVFMPCEDCGSTVENWVCLHCYKVFCGRFMNEHMLFHGIASEHKVVLSYADLSVWCYACDSYIHNEVLLEAKQAAHISKFGEAIPC